MNQEIEQRIVAMYFDNKDFEKNAKETIKTLGDLRDNLNLEDSVKGFEELDKAGKKLNLTNVKQTINGMKNSLGGFQSVLNKAFTVGTAPVRSLENFFHTFQGYVGKFVGFDLASKFVSSLENALRQLTVAPVEAGWNMYQANVDSVKTIMSGTLQSYKKQMSEVDSDWTYGEEEHMEYVKGQLRELSNYAQQTVFSLTDMTNNVGKFTNNNIDLETSVIAMEGIANMTAKAGQGAQQASMAMYNFSQALGVGKMTSLDWKSIENANIATTELKQLFIDSAVAGGRLEKQVEKLADGKEITKYFQTVDENGKKLAKNKWIEISAENFRDTLREGWLDKQTMLNTMKIYSGKINDVDDLKAMGFDVENEELVKYLMNIGEQAALAATQVRTFSKMWDAMTEAVQSGWADSMELIFGDMTEATEFWTEINNRIGGVLDASAEERNKMLHEWRGETYDEMEKAWKRVDGAYDGREDLIHGIYDVIAAARALGGTFKDAWRSVFGQTDGKKLQEITKAFHDLTSGFNQWLGGQRDKSGETRLDKIRKGLKGILSILKTVGNVFRTVFGVISKLAAPIADTFINLFGKIGGFFDGLGELNAGQVIAKLRDGMHRLWDAIVKLFSPTEIEDELGRKTGKRQSPIAHFLEATFGNIKKDVAQWFQDNDLSGVWNAIEDAWEWIKEIWEKIANWEGWAAIGAFFTNVYFAVRDYFAPKEMRRYNGSQLESYFTDSPFVASIKRIWEKVKSVWNTIVGWEGWASIGGFFSNIGSWISERFGETINWFTVPTANGETGFTNWLNDVKTKLEAFWNPICNWEGWKQIGMFFAGIGSWIENRFGEAVDFFSTPTANGETGFTNWLNDMLVQLDAFWTPIREWSGWTEIGTFFGDIWSGIEGFAGTAIDFFTTPTDNGETGFTNWLNSIFENLELFWAPIRDWEGWTAIGNFFSDIGSWISDQFGIVVNWFTEPTDNGETGFSNWLTSIRTFFETAWADVVGWEGWASIGGFFSNIGNWISEQFGIVVNWFSEPTDNGKTGFVIWLEEFAADVSRIWGIIVNWEGWKKIGEFFSDIFSWIMGLFGNGESAEEAASTKKSKSTGKSKLSALKDKAHIAADEAKGANKELSIFERILNTIGEFLNRIGEFLTGKDLTGVTKFFEAIGTFFNGLLDIVTKVLDSAGKFLSATAEGGLGAGWNSLGGETQTTIILSAVIALIGEIISLVKTRWESKIDSGESVAHKIAELGVALLAISLALGVISLIPTDKLIAGGIVLAVILGALTMVSKNLAAISNQNATTPTERVLTKLITSVEKMGTIAIVMALLPEIIKAFGEMKKQVPEMTGLDIAGILIGLASAVALIFVAFSLSDKILGNSKGNWGNIGAYAKIALLLVGVVAVVAAIGYASDQIIGTKTMLQSLKDAKEILTMTGEAVGGLIGGIVAGLIEPIRKALGYQTNEEKMEESMNILSSIADRIEYFTPDKISGINRILSSVGMLSQTVQSVPDASKILGFASALEPMATAMIKMGVALAGFTEQNPGVQGLSIDDVEANIIKMADIVRAFTIPKLEYTSASNFIRTIDTLSEQMTDERFKAFGDISAKFIASFNEATAPYSDTMKEAGGSLLTNLSAALRIGMGSNSIVGAFDAQPVIDAICNALAAGQVRVASEVHSMIQEGINSSPDAQGEGGYDLSGVINNDFMNLFHLDNGFDLSTLFGGSPDLALQQLGATLYGAGGTEDNPKKDSIFGMLGGLTGYMDNLEFASLDESIGQINEKLTFKDAEGNPIDLATYLQDNINQMSESLKNAEETFSITIVPTLDWTNLTAESIRSQLGDMPIDFPTMLNLSNAPLKIDTTGLAADLQMGFIQDELLAVENAIDAERIAVVEAINSMSVRIDGVSAAVRSMRLYLDTGLLVGGITPYVDHELGRRAALASRTGVTPR